MRIIFIHGRPASGKLTIAKEIARRTGLPLFHNHLTVDLLLAVFPFGSPGFILNREKIWMEVMKSAALENRSLIFTFNPERTVSLDFPKKLESEIKATGGVVSYVEIHCPWKTVEERIALKERIEFKKLASPELFLQLRESGAFDYPSIPSELRIDSSQIEATEAASQIIEHLRLKEIA